MIDRVFADCECPQCGSTCGNGGHGDIFRCSACGWTGKIEMHQDDTKALQDIIRRNQERVKEAHP